MRRQGIPHHGKARKAVPFVVVLLASLGVAQPSVAAAPLTVRAAKAATLRVAHETASGLAPGGWTSSAVRAGSCVRGGPRRVTCRYTLTAERSGKTYRCGERVAVRRKRGRALRTSASGWDCALVAGPAPETPHSTPAPAPSGNTQPTLVDYAQRFATQDAQAKLASGLLGTITFDRYAISDCGTSSTIAANCTVWLRGWRRVSTAADAPYYLSESGLEWAWYRYYVGARLSVLGVQSRTWELVSTPYSLICSDEPYTSAPACS